MFKVEAADILLGSNSFRETGSEAPKAAVKRKAEEVEEEAKKAAKKEEPKTEEDEARRAGQRARDFPTTPLNRELEERTL